MKMQNRSTSSVKRLAGCLAIAAFGTIAWAASPAVEKAVVTTAPTDKAVGVLEAKAKSESGQKVVVEGKVKDFVAGNAVFTIADKSMKSCKDNGEDCPTPWDFCCETKDTISKNTATVMIVAPGEKKPIKEEVKGVKGIDHLVSVSAEGTIQKDKAGNLVVYAERVYVTK